MNNPTYLTTSANDIGARSLPDSTHISRAHFRISDADKSLVFYKDLLGLKGINSGENTTILSDTKGEEPILLLTEDRHAKPRPQRSTGLYHLAFLYPTRRDLAAAFIRLHTNGWPFQGFADHGVSEALYLADPDGNGIELYVDRPRARWPYRNGELQMMTETLDLDGLLSELQGNKLENASTTGITIGHIHLQVSDIGLAEQFYHQALGFDVTQRNFPGALFLSAGGYHHHIGVNTWGSRDASPSPGDSLGLISFGIQLGDKQAVDTLAGQMRQTKYWTNESDRNSIVRDSDNIQIEIS
jgi:catechol 2,3-dioxygenase